MIKNSLICIIFGIFLVACSAKNTDELYNLSANEWYLQIIKDLQDKDLEKADTHYLGMASEHIADPLLETTLIILAQSHIDDENYQKAEFYLDEYNKKFGNLANADHIRYLRIKAKFNAFKVPNRDQALMLKSQGEIDSFLRDYGHTKYEPLIQTMLTKFNLAVFFLDSAIADLYDRTDRVQSFEIYQKRLQESEFYNKDYIKPELPWYRAIFEKF